MNLALVADGAILQQKNVNDANDLFNMFMNTGGYMLHGEYQPMKRYSELSLQERVFQFEQNLKGMNNMYYTKAGELIDFNEITDAEERVKVITEKVLKDYDEFSTDLKKTLLGIFNSHKNVTPQDLVRGFGVDGSEREIMPLSIAEDILKHINYNPKMKFFKYSDLKNSKEYGYIYNERLQGVDPIVIIEHDKDDQVVISLYNFTNQFIKQRDKLSPLDVKNILTRYIGSDGYAERKGLSYQSNMGDVSNVMLGLIASDLAAGDAKKIKINNIGTIGVNRKNTTMVLVVVS